MEALLLDLVPQGPDWSGVGEQQIAQVEALAGRPLPPFYRWFLGRFGHTMGTFTYRSLDFSCKGILAAYAEQRVEYDPRYLLIAYDHDPAYPSHAFYDLDRPARDDALVVAGEYIDEDELVPSFETLREMIAWGALASHGVYKQPQRCAGMLQSTSGDVLPELDPVLRSFGLESAIETGRYCGVYRGASIDFISKSTPGKNPRLQAFDMGASDATKIRRLLGEVTQQTSLELEISRWDPLLP
jgi:hypothetical protein